MGSPDHILFFFQHGTVRRYKTQLVTLDIYCVNVGAGLSECLINGADYYVDGNTLKFSASMLSINSTPATFYFYAEISWEDGRNVVQVLPVTVAVGDQPVVHIRCLGTCQPSNMSRDDDVIAVLRFIADCDNCAPDERLVYDWTLDITNASTLGAAMPLGQHGRQFAVNILSLNYSHYAAFHIVRVIGLCSTMF